MMRVLNAVRVRTFAALSVMFAVGISTATSRGMAQGTPPRLGATPLAVSSAAEVGLRRAARATDTQRSIDGVADGQAFRGVVRAIETATISAELNARILKLPYRDGDQFKQGDVLVQFDCVRLDADVEAAAAAYRARRVAHHNQLQLGRYRAAGRASVDQARFEAEKALAELVGLKAKRETCIVVAPFSGRVVERTANAHEVAQPNQQLMKIVNDSRLELVLMVPSRWIARVRPGMTFSFRVDETGKVYPATVTQIGGAIEPVSQSVRLTGEMSVQSADILLGMSGTAILTATEHGP